MTLLAPAAAAARLHGARPEAVIAAIQERAARRRAGDPRADGRKIALVIEGGAMRAVCSAGGAAALAHMVLSDVFDEVYATSAGAMNASYFLSHQPSSGIRVYFENCTTRAFLNPLRFWKVLDVDYIFDYVVTVEKPLDVQRVMSSRSTLYVAVADRHTGEGRLIDTRTSNAPLLAVLKAATAIPVLYNRSVMIEGRPSVDGGMAIPFPLEQALSNGCTDVMVLLTRSADHVSVPPNSASRWMFDALCGRGAAGLNRAFATRHERANAARALALGRTPAPNGARIATLCPDAPEAIGRTTSDPAALRAAATRYGRAMLRAFGVDAPSWDVSMLSDG